MRKLVVALGLLIATMARAHGFGEVRFGMVYDEALSSIKTVYGEPVVANSDVVSYYDVAYEGFRWDEISFRFTNGKLTEARCYMNHKNKGTAAKQLSAIAQAMQKSYAMTMDYEEDGNVFYAGGKSPVGIGHLFVVFMSPRDRMWTSQLRFGPFRFK